MAEPRVLKLVSPAYGDPVYYKWPLLINKKIDEGQEIAETIRHVCEDFPELKYAVENSILKEVDSRDYECMNQLCQRYNKAIRNILTLWKGRAPPPRMYKPPNRELLRHIITISYNHAVKTPEKLNQYEPFSPEVYGETSFDMIAQILDEAKATKDDCFIDLGSGVGQVVLQAAASNKFKECFGIEKAETPADFAKTLEVEFRKWMDWFGKIYTEFTLEKGDFLESKFQDKINDSRFIFVNNFAFGPQLNHSLKTRFQHLTEGSKIISSREFCPMNFKFNKRNLSELGAMMRVTEIKPRSEEATVSWTGNSVNYYLHVVDRTRLEKYFAILKKKKDGQELEEDELSLYSESNYSADTTTETTAPNIESLEDNLDDLYLGTTTRHQWQLLNETIKQSKQDAKEGGQSQKKNLVVSSNKSNIQKKPIGKTTINKINLKNRILKKYGHTRMINRFSTVKKIPKIQHTSSSSASSSDPSSDDDYESEEDVSKKKTSFKKPFKLKSSLVVRNNLERKDVESKKSKPKITNKKHLVESPRKNEVQLEHEVENFLGTLKQGYVNFIKRVNTKEYADQLKVMIECEAAKKKILQREVMELECSVQSLINAGLKNFSSRLLELDVAVKTPVELLSKSTTLAERHRELENKVVSMEIEVSSLEEKYRSMCMVRDENSRQKGLSPLVDSDLEELVPSAEKIQLDKELLRNKLCVAILSALNHRKSLIDRESLLSEQVDVLEKMKHDSNADVNVDDNSGEKNTMKKEIVQKQVSSKKKSKSRPVAFVPPRMLSADKKNTISPITSVAAAFPSGAAMLTASSEQVARRRGRPRKKQRVNSETRQRSSSTDTSQDSKTEPLLAASTASNFGGDIPSETYTLRDYANYSVFEERAPITFPQQLKRPVSSNDIDMKNFFKSSSALLNTALHTASAFPKGQANLIEQQREHHKKQYPENLTSNNPQYRGNGVNSSAILTGNALVRDRDDRDIAASKPRMNIVTSQPINERQTKSNDWIYSDPSLRAVNLSRPSHIDARFEREQAIAGSTPLNTPHGGRSGASSVIARGNIQEIKASTNIRKEDTPRKRKAVTKEHLTRNERLSNSFSQAYPQFVAKQDDVVKNNALQSRSAQSLKESRDNFGSRDQSVASNVDLHFKESLEKLISKHNKILMSPLTPNSSLASFSFENPVTVPVSVVSSRNGSWKMPELSAIHSNLEPKYEKQHRISNSSNVPTYPVNSHKNLIVSSHSSQNILTDNAISSLLQFQQSKSSLATGVSHSTTPKMNFADIPNIPPTASILSTIKHTSAHATGVSTTASNQHQLPVQHVSTAMLSSNRRLLPNQIVVNKISPNAVEMQNGLTLLNSHLLSNTSTELPYATSGLVATSVSSHTVIRPTVKVISGSDSNKVSSIVESTKKQQKIAKASKAKLTGMEPPPAKKPRGRKPKNIPVLSSSSSITVSNLRPELAPISYVVPISDAINLPSVIPNQSIIPAANLPQPPTQIINTNTKSIVRPQVVNLQLQQPQYLPPLTTSVPHPVNLVQLATPSVIAASAAPPPSQRVFFLHVSNAGVITTNSLSNHLERHSSLASPTFPPPSDKS